MPRNRRFRATGVAALLAGLAGSVRAEEGPPVPPPPLGRVEAGDDALRIALAESRAVAGAAAVARTSVVALRALGTGRDAYGTGIIVSREGLILTALHVVDGATAIAVVLGDGEELTGAIRAQDRGIDLALLEVVDPPRAFVPATIAPDHVAEVGETVVAISNPFGLGVSVSRGVLSAVDRRGVVEGQSTPLLQTDAAINPGSSGGALVNLQGEVLGLITAIVTRSGGHQGVGFAVPAHELRRALVHLERGESIPRPWLGVRVLRDPASPGGLKVLRVAPGGPAEAAGIRPGDVLTAVRGRSLGRPEDLREALSDMKPGDPVVVDLSREGRAIALDVKVGDRS